jgi:hypothetical protein
MPLPPLGVRVAPVEISVAEGFVPTDERAYRHASGAPSTRCARSGHHSTKSFDVTPDGTQIVFDGVRDISDVVLIDLAR